MRRAVAKSLTASKQEAPHFYLDATCLVDSLLELRKNINLNGSVKVSINDFVVKAVVKSLIDVPEMNVVWMQDSVRQFNSVDVAIAISSTKGLVTPVIRSAENLTLTQISNQIKDFAARANEGRLKQHEIEGGSFSVTNLGMFGVESFSAILNPPQVGILAVGAIVNQPIVVDGSLEVGNTLKVTLSVDHRPVDGVLAAQWLKRFKTLIENPALILA
jgi:pyruvate dehydrogenase E2 component (dihydrolipoamide acetyltransferase)